MDNFFSYGVPVPPTYYAHGGAFPMAQAENQFFSPFYGNVPNPYNKAMGGSSEAYRQAIPYGDTGRSTRFMMQDGGYTADEQQLPKMGVDGKLTNFLAIVNNTATDKVNDNLRKHGKTKNREQYLFEQGISEYGGNIRRYQSKKESAQTDPLLDRIARGTRGDSSIFKPLDLPQIDANSDKGTASPPSTPSANNPYNPYYGPQGAGMQLPPEYYNDIDYMYRGRMRPRSDFDIKGSGIFGKYRSTGWLEDEYGLDRLTQMGLTDIKYDKPKWYQLLKRPTKTYHFGPQGQGPQQDMQLQTGAQRDDGKQVFVRDPNDPNYKVDLISGEKVNDGIKIFTGNSYTGESKPDDKAQFKHDNPHLGGMGFFERRFKNNKDVNDYLKPITPQLGTMTNVTPDQQVQGPDMVSQRNPQMWTSAFTPRRNQRIQKRLGNIDRKLDKLELFDTWQDAQTGEDGDLSGMMGREMKRLRNRYDRLENRIARKEKEFGGELDNYQSKKTTGTVKTPKGQELPLNDHRFNERTAFKPSMTVEEYLRSREMPEGLKQQIIDSNDPNIQWTPMQGVVDRKQVGNQPVGATTIIPLVVPPSSNNSKPSFYAPGADMFDGVEYITPDSVNFDSTNTDHRAAMMRAILSGATDDSYDELLPSMKKKKYGGSHSVGDVVDMTPEELQKFIEMGGQVEFLD